LPRFFNFSDKTSEKLLNAAIAELNGKEKLAFVDAKKSRDRWVNDQIVFSQVNTDMGSGFHWAPKANKKWGHAAFLGPENKFRKDCLHKCFSWQMD
jgi:hypothetical protein